MEAVWSGNDVCVSPSPLVARFTASFLSRRSDLEVIETGGQDILYYRGAFEIILAVRYEGVEFSFISPDLKVTRDITKIILESS
jgi:hypothetical protein